jgi:hypothetical protein
MACADQLDEASAMFGAVTGGDELLDNGVDAYCDLRRRQSEVGRPHHLALAH